MSSEFDVGSGHVEGLVNGAFLHVLGDSLGLNVDDWLSKSHDLSFGVLSDVAGLSLLEDNNLLFVLLQSLDVSAEVFSGFVSSSGVNADADLFGFSESQLEKKLKKKSKCGLELKIRGSLAKLRQKHVFTVFHVFRRYFSVSGHFDALIWPFTT